MRSCLNFVIGAVVLVIVVLVVGSYTFLPNILEDRIAESVQQSYGLDEKPEVELTGNPPPRMLIGQFSGGEIVMRDAVFAGLTTETTTIGLRPFDVDIPQSIQDGTLVASGDGTGSLRITVSEDEVRRVANSAVGLDGVSLEEGDVVIRRTQDIGFGIQVPFEVRGGLRLAGQSLEFTPGEIAIAGFSLPQETQDALLGQTQLTIPLEDVPAGVTLDSVEVQGDELVITGETQTGL